MDEQTEEPLQEGLFEPEPASTGTEAEKGLEDLLNGRSKGEEQLRSIVEAAMEKGAAAWQQQAEHLDRQIEDMSQQIGELSGELEKVRIDKRVLTEMHDRCRERWLRIATARWRGMPLPPVDLVQVRDCYFVQDGHHRISVARALGQTNIEARVTVWHVSGPLPWETRATSSEQGPSKPRRQKTLAGRLYHRILIYARTLQAGRRERVLGGGSAA